MTLESEIRDTLQTAARASQVPDGLAERLIARSQDSSVSSVTSDPRRHRTRLTPLIAAAVVILVVGAIALTAVLVGRSHHSAPASPVVTPTVSVPTPSPSTSPSTASTPPSSPTSPTRTAAPADFRASDVQFRDALHATALGIGNCTGSSTGSCRVSLIATDDGGASWYRLGAPAGLHSMFPTSDADGSCLDNGDVLGPCVDHVLFADADHGYLWGLHAMYSTTDGGRTWSDQRTGVGFGGAQAVAVGGQRVFRIVPTSEGSVPSVPAELQVSALGSTSWTDISPTGSLSWFSDVVATSDAVLVADRSTDQSASPAVRLYRSTDGGGHWSRIGSADLTAGLAGATGGRLAALTAVGSTCSLTTVTAGGAVDAAPVQVGCAPSSTVQPGPATLIGLAGDGHAVLLTGAASTSTAYPVTVQRLAPGSSRPVPVATFTVEGRGYTGRSRFTGDVGVIQLGDSRAVLTTDGGLSWRTIQL